MKKLSIRDIGKELGVSITTVSFILNGKAKEKRISDALTKKVLDFVEKVNYSPNVMAQALRTGKSKIICLMVEDISNNNFFSQVARQIEEQAHQNGYRIIFCSTDNSKEKTSELIKIFRDRLIDGYIITPPIGIEKQITSLLDDNIPVILADRNLPEISCTSVMINNGESAMEATTHLLEQGYNHVAFITIESSQPQMHDRMSGYLKAIENNPSYILKLDYHTKPAENTTHIINFLTENPSIDSIFFATDYLCTWGLRAIKELGFHIPNRIGIVSFDDMDLFKLYNPSISAIEQPVEAISSNILQLMLDKLEGNQRADELHEVVLNAKLISRESSKKNDLVGSGSLLTKS